MTSIVDDIRMRIEERLEELAPLIREYEQLVALKRQLDAPPATASPARPRGIAAAPRRRAAAAGGTRAQQSVALVAARPGITTDEIAREMGIDRNYLYRVLPRLER